MRRHVPHVMLLLLAAALAPGAAAAQAPTLTSETLAGLTLRNIGPANMSGRVVDMEVVESDPYTMYVASSTGGVWKTGNNGVTWWPVFEKEGTHSVGDIAMHQRDTNIVWVGTGERANRQSNSWGDGVYKSTDAGRTWTNMGLRESRHVGRIRLHPENPDIVFVAAMGHLWGPNRERGLYKSSDGGKSWRNVLFVDENSGVVDVAIDHEDPSVMYAASYQRQRKPFGFHGGGPGSALWKSTDGGESWRKLTAGLPGGPWGRIGIDIYRKDSDTLYITLEKGYRFNASTAYVRRAGDAGVFRSTDKGETWQHMSDWNPRPMYASQIHIDPNDACVLYMQNEFARSTDCGKSFQPLDQTLHGDDRYLWIDPADSRHMVKLDDGGIGISYDRGAKWLFVSSLPLSQWYRVALDNDNPYNIYGGLQDNGSWVGPNATYRSEGILNEDWTRTGGGDGFLSIADTLDADVFYTESQYLGLLRRSLRTGQAQEIRPGDPKGAIGARRNFDWFFAGENVGELENAMAPGNWDGPYAISPHDNDVLYAGTDRLWKSADGGQTWSDLGDMTTGADRREMKIMGQAVGDSVPSIDDGAPYWPTLSIIAESPLRAGLLYVGTDDGRVRGSRDGGATWTELHGRIGGLPTGSWINGIEPSAHQAERVFVVANNYRDDDNANYLYRSDDQGATWRDITGDLPAERVLRTVREDPRNPDVLWLGSELGLFVTVDGGAHWVELKNNMPTLPFNDLRIHPRDNDLVLATHGRGVWILDQVNAIQEITPQVLAARAHLFTAQPAEQIRYQSEKAHTGDMYWAGENPPAGAIIDYYLRTPASGLTMVVLDARGGEVARLAPDSTAGINRVIWNLRHANLPAAPGARAGAVGPAGPWVVPGTYTVRMTVDGATQDRTVEVREDPRVQSPAALRQAWTADLVRIADLFRGATTALAAARQANAPADRRAQLTELRSRINGLYGEVGGFVGPLTADQRAQFDYYTRMLGELGG